MVRMCVLMIGVWVYVWMVDHTAKEVALWLW
jgi:hypothetical protein